MLCSWMVSKTDQWASVRIYRFFSIYQWEGVKHYIKTHYCLILRFISIYFYMNRITFPPCSSYVCDFLFHMREMRSKRRFYNHVYSKCLFPSSGKETEWNQELVSVCLSDHPTIRLCNKRVLTAI